MHISRNTRVAVTRRGRDGRAGVRLISRLVAAAFLATSVLGPVSGIPMAGAVEPPAAAAEGSAPLVASSPFISSPGTHTFYRVPTVIKNAQGAILVFAERRNNSDGSDHGDFDIVMRKSTDGGRTWGPIRTIANDGKNKVSSPVAVLDPRTGDVLLICIVRTPAGVYLGHFLQRSTNGGDSFTPLSSSRLSNQRPWTGRPGPGHAIVLTKGAHAGRIVIAMGGSHDVHGVYSDDGGRTWRSGFAQADPSGTDLVEGTIAELPSGALFICYRDCKTETRGRTKRYAYSYDGGATLAAPLAPLSAVKTPSVEGSALNPVGSHSGELLLSGPTYNSTASPDKRRDMGIFVSKDGGATWGRPYPVDLESKAASYSDLVQMDDGTIGVLYEVGRVTWLERIMFKTVRLSQLTEPTKAPSSVSAKLSDATLTTSQNAKVNVTVAVKGIVRPLGKLVVTYTGATVSGTVSAALTYRTFGKRQLALPKLKRGTYAISATYQGAFRIAGRTVSAGTLRVR